MNGGTASGRAQQVPEPTPAQIDAVLKPVDSAWTVLVIDPVAQRVLPWVNRRRWITPMGLTVAATVLGVVSAVMFALSWSVPAALLFEFRFLIDCLDGRVARIRGTSSAAGARADVVGDRIVLVSVLAGVSWSAGVLWLGALGAAAYIAYFVTKNRRDGRLAATGASSTAERLGSAGLGQRLRDRRIYPLITSVDVEHAAFFVAPLVTAVSGVGLSVISLAVVAAYFVANAARFALGAARLGADAIRP